MYMGVPLKACFFLLCKYIGFSNQTLWNQDYLSLPCFISSNITSIGIIFSFFALPKKTCPTASFRRGNKKTL